MATIARSCIRHLPWRTIRRSGTYTFYCVLHANKATGQGMVGKLVVTP